MKKSSIITKLVTVAATLLGSVVLFAATVQAETIEGKLNGLECASHGEQCPIDRLDPHLAFERDFVVQTADGKYYFITNVDRAVKVRHVLKMVRVKGTVSTKFDAINASELWVKEGGDFKIMWSTAMQEEERRRMRGYITPE